MSKLEWVHRRPTVRFLSDSTLQLVIEEAYAVLGTTGVLIEHAETVERLSGAGAGVSNDGRIRMSAALIDRARAAAPSGFSLWDRGGTEEIVIGGGQASFAPGSAAIRVLDHEKGTLRPARLADCEKFAHLTEKLPAYRLQSTCVVPEDVPMESADKKRLAVALQNSRKPVVTGTFMDSSFQAMKQMLVCVRGGEAELRSQPLAVFDCCPTSPLKWSELTCAALVGCAESAIPAELVSVPMTGATSPVTLIGAIIQHAAENLSGLVIHQLVAAGAPLIWGACGAGFDMRYGTMPLGAPESMMINAATSEVGRALGLPTHGYLGLSDSKTLDYQAGLESGVGAMTAALSGLDVISGPGMLELVGSQSLEKLVLDNEACLMAARMVRGVEMTTDDPSAEVIAEGVAAEQFLNLKHTRRLFRKELHFPGAVIDRQDGETWTAMGGTSAGSRAREEVVRLLAEDGAPPLDDDVLSELHELMG